MHWFRGAKNPDLDLMTKFRLAVPYLNFCTKNSSDKKLERMLNEGNQKIQSMLDLRKMIRHFRAVETLQKLLLPSEARKLIQM